MAEVVPILIAEDDENDAFLLKRTIEKCCEKSDIHLVSDGEEAIYYLAGKGKYSDRHRYPYPAYFLTDLKMPKKTGLEVLQWLKKHSQCNAIPVIIWSSSRIAADVARAYELGANCFFQKPNSTDDWHSVIELIVRFWNTAEKPMPPTL